jgi:hypothetical protein
VQVVRIIRKRFRSTSEGVDLDAALNAAIAINVEERHGSASAVSRPSADAGEPEDRSRPRRTQPPHEGGTT